jgi:hypothetical protein
MFTFEPFVGPLPLRFGMSPEEVASVVGAPSRVFPDFFKNRTETRPGLSLGYDATSGRLVEAVFPSVGLHFHGVDLFVVDDAIAFLRQFDPAPQIAVGMVFFVDLGLRLSGFHDNDESQRAIGVVATGHWEELARKFVPFETR